MTADGLTAPCINSNVASVWESFVRKPGRMRLMLQVHAVAATDARALALQAPLFEGCCFVDKQIFFSAGFSLQPVASKKAPIHVGACQLNRMACQL